MITNLEYFKHFIRFRIPFHSMVVGFVNIGLNCLLKGKYKQSIQYNYITLISRDSVWTPFVCYYWSGDIIYGSAQLFIGRVLVGVVVINILNGHTGVRTNWHTYLHIYKSLTSSYILVCIIIYFVLTVFRILIIITNNWNLYSVLWAFLWSKPWWKTFGNNILNYF